MDILKRIWSYVSPTKMPQQPSTPAATLAGKRHAGRTRNTSLQDITRDTRSMSPTERVGNWNDTSLASAAAGLKQKRPLTPITSGTGRFKIRRMEDVDMEMQEDEMDVDKEDTCGRDAPMGGGDDTSDLTSLILDIHVRSPRAPVTPSSPNDFLYDSDSQIDIDETTVVDDATYHSTPRRRTMVSLPKEQEALGVSTAALRGDGWSDDQITILQKIKLRGEEPLLPKHWKFGFRFMPDALFANDDDSAFIGSLHNKQFPAEKAFEKLLELGPRMRDADREESQTPPEAHVGKILHAYIKWAVKDAGLDPDTYISNLALSIHPESTTYGEMHNSAIRSLESLTASYRGAFRATPSTEAQSCASPRSDGTQLSHPVPQLYAIIASHTIVAVSAYRPGEQLIPMMYFDFRDLNCDAWNSIALAIVICHARNVLVHVAKETGLGLAESGDGMRENAEEDMDL